MESTLKAAESPAVAAYRCLIVEDDTLISMGLQSLLQRLGHGVVGQASTDSDAESIFREKNPDLVFMDIRLNHGDGIELTSRLLKIRACPIIVVSAYSDKNLIDRATAAGVFGYLIKPVSGAALEAQIEVAVARFRERMVLVAEKEALAQSLEHRKLVDRAKGIIMHRLGISEPEAHKRLQQESQKRRSSLVELAKKLIESEELLGGM